MGVLRSIVNMLPPPVAQAIREARAKRREETRRERIAEASSNETLTNFWWEHGRAWAEHEAGDHLIVIGKVVAMSPPEWHRHEPLLFFKGSYRHLRDLDQLAG